MMFRDRAAALALVTAMTVGASHAPAQEMAAAQRWADTLRRQMLAEQHCVVAYTGQISERQSPYLVRAKVTCEDQRVFTVEQDNGPEQPFKVVICNREGPSC